MSQTADASGGSNLFQAGGNITVEGTVMAVQYSLTAPPVDMELVPAPPGFGRAPAVAEAFVGRGVELERLDRAVTRVDGRMAVAVVHGRGGVGKSAVVARFAELRRPRFVPVWWITADSAAALDTGLAELALALAPHVAIQSAEQRVESAVRWLASHDDWLLVLDDLVSPGDVARLSGRVRTGTVIITSREANGWRGTPAVELDVLSPEEAVELLSRSVRQEWPEADLTGAAALCAELGRQPWAINRAASHLARDRVTPLACLDGSAELPAGEFTVPIRDKDIPRLVRNFDATLDHEVRCGIVRELAGSGTAAAMDALRTLRPRYEVERLVIREALEA